MINFENKLKGLEDRPDYPKEKPWYFRQRAGTNADYNILSNIPLQEHHFAAPDKRPPAPEEKKQKVKKMTTTGLRDYNIVTGRYLELHEDKLKADQEIQRAEAAYKYWQTHNFDPLVCKLYDADKETQYLEKRKADALVHGKDEVKKLPITVQNEGLLYNPVNMKIEDRDRLY